MVYIHGIYGFYGGYYMGLCRVLSLQSEAWQVFNQKLFVLGLESNRQVLGGSGFKGHCLGSKASEPKAQNPRPFRFMEFMA